MTLEGEGGGRDHHYQMELFTVESLDSMLKQCHISVALLHLRSSKLAMADVRYLPQRLPAPLASLILVLPIANPAFRQWKSRRATKMVTRTICFVRWPPERGMGWPSPWMGRCTRGVTMRLAR